MRAGAFSNSAHPDDDAKHGRVRNPTGHGGVYKVDGHGRPEPSVGEGEMNFSSLPGVPEPPPTSPFSFPVGLPVATLIALRQIAFWSVVQSMQQKLHIISRLLSMCYDGRFCFYTTRLHDWGYSYRILLHL